MNDVKKVEFRGRQVIEKWPEELRQAQLAPTVVLNGTEYTRVRYGEEARSWGDGPCHDCVAVKGEFHVAGCDVERCPLCGLQFIGCGCQ